MVYMRCKHGYSFPHSPVSANNRRPSDILRVWPGPPSHHWANKQTPDIANTGRANVGEMNLSVLGNIIFMKEENTWYLRYFSTRKRKKHWTLKPD